MKKKVLELEEHLRSGFINDAIRHRISQTPRDRYGQLQIKHCEIVSLFPDKEERKIVEDFIRNNKDSAYNLEPYASPYTRTHYYAVRPKR